MQQVEVLVLVDQEERFQVFGDNSTTYFGGPGIGATNGTTLNIVISGSDTIVNATAKKGATGIRSGGNNLATDITINDGTVTAQGGEDGAGIGGGYGSEGSYITINDGNVTAQGGDNGAGIGGGSGNNWRISGGNGSNITITGGKVIANGGAGSDYNNLEGGAGIGIGYNSTNNSTFSTSDSGDVLIIAKSENGDGISDKTSKTNWSGVIIGGVDGQLQVI